MFPYLFLNDRIVEARGAAISPLDRGFLLGEGVFETLRTCGGVPFRLAAHVRRLHAGARWIGIDLSAAFPARRFRRIVRALVEANGIDAAALRITVTPGAAGGGADGPAGATVLVHARALAPLPDSARSEGVAVIVAGPRRDPSWPILARKTTSYLANLRLRGDAARAGAFDALCLNLDGSLAEGTASNIFLVCGGSVLTPDPSAGILPGILRDSVLRLCRREGIPARERRVDREDLLRAEEAFLTNSLVGILPVRRIGDRSLPWPRGPVTRRLGCLLEAWIRRTARRGAAAAGALDEDASHDIT